MQIDKNSEAFNNIEFQKEKYKYNLFYKMLNRNNYLFYSDLENYIIGRDYVGNPIWIWTKDNISPEKVKELEELLNIYLVEEKNAFTCKKELYDYLKRDLNCLDDYYFEMGFLLCHKLNNTPISNGYLDIPNYGDKTTLAKYWYDNCLELYPSRNMTFLEALQEMDEWLNDDKMFVWRNPDRKVVAMAKYSVINDQAKITHVFTPKEERHRGYCTSLVHEITKEILSCHLVPILYTDYNFEESNRTYKKIGYEDNGFLVNFNIIKKN